MIEEMIKNNFWFFCLSSVIASIESIILRYKLPEEKPPMHPLANLTYDLLDSGLPNLGLVPQADGLQFSILSVHLVKKDRSKTAQLPADDFVVDSSLLLSRKSVDRESLCAEAKYRPVAAPAKSSAGLLSSSSSSSSSSAFELSEATSLVPLSSVPVLHTPILHLSAPSSSSSSPSSRHDSPCYIKIDLLIFSIYPIQLHWIIAVIVDILDENDNEPRFAEASIHLKLLESLSIGSRFLLPTARDDDFGPFSLQRYSLFVAKTAHKNESQRRPFSATEVSQKLSSLSSKAANLFLKSQNISSEHSERSMFALEMTSDELFLVLSASLDRETEESHHLLLFAYDGGAPALSGLLSIQVEVLDVNDNAPIFLRSSYTFEVAENAPPATIVGRISATDDDRGVNAKLIYKLLFNSAEEASRYGSLFSVDNETGDFVVLSSLDREVASRYSLIAQAMDPSSNPLTGFTQISVEVRDVNDNPPSIAFNSLYPFDRDKDYYLLPRALPVDSAIGYFSINDPDVDAVASCALTSDSLEFALRSIDLERFELAIRVHSNRSITSSVIVCKDSGQAELASKEILNFKFVDNFENYDLEIVPQSLAKQFDSASVLTFRNNFADPAFLHRETTA